MNINESLGRPGEKPNPRSPEIQAEFDEFAKYEDDFRRAVVKAETLEQLSSLFEGRVPISRLFHEDGRQSASVKDVANAIRNSIEDLKGRREVSISDLGLPILPNYLDEKLGQLLNPPLQ